MRTSSVVKATVAPLLLAVTMASAASDTCISLQGSSMCPSFQQNFVRPSKLADSFTFFQEVSDVTSFDTLFQHYLLSQNQYYTNKIELGLQCNTSLATNVTVQWQQTVFCSQFSEAAFESGCTSESGDGPVLVCQSTCDAFSTSENDIVDNTAYCQNTNELNAFQRSVRSDTLSNDYYTCTDFGSAATSTSATCVLGVQNEGSCGYGYSADQMCAHCDPSGGVTVPSCCTEAGTDLSQCSMWGHPLATTIQPTATVATNVGALATGSATDASGSVTGASAAATATDGASASAGNGVNGSGSATMTGAATRATNSRSATSTSSIAYGASGNNVNGKQYVDAADQVFSKGQLAGIIIGCIIGAGILGALLAFCCLRKRGNKNDPERNTVYGNAGNESRPWIQSEEAMVKSPEVGKGSNAGKFAGAAALGAGAGAVGAGAVAAGKASSEDRPNSAMSGDTGTDGRGTSIPAVKDQYSSHDICPGETVVAIYPYNATLNDEITLQPDDVVTVQRLYDDGWALGRTEAGGEGAFPLVCVTSTKGGSSGEGGNEGNNTSSADGGVTAEDGFSSERR